MLTSGGILSKQRGAADRGLQNYGGRKLEVTVAQEEDYSTTRKKLPVREGTKKLIL